MVVVSAVEELNQGVESQLSVIRWAGYNHIVVVINKMDLVAYS